MTCPKRMVFGPCGGVAGDGSCELDAGLCCPWADPSDPAPLLPWPGEPATHRAAPAAPAVLADFSVPAYDLATQRRVLGVLAPAADALLVGEDQHRPDFPPVLKAREILDAGARAWVTLTCRDRNRVVLEQELAGLAALGAEVFCVTGDGSGPEVRPGVTQVFDLDATRLTALAHDVGLDPAVAVTPGVPPERLRPRALAEKQRAGAVAAVANHVASPGVLDTFLRAARDAGADLPVIAGVAVYTDEPTATTLAALPGLALDPDVVADVLGAPDPVAAGIDAAVAEATALLAVPGVVGVNLSGLGSTAGWVPAAEIKAEIARRVREHV